MSRRCLSVWMGLWVLAVGGALLGGAWAYGASPTTPEAQKMFIYAHPDGTKYFGLCVRPQVQVQPVAGQSIVILFDTSAGQVGDFRAKALEVLEQLLQKLGPEDRVQLVGVDVNAVALAEGFVPAQSDQMKQAVEKLRQRTPLGATDMEKAILTASELLQSQQGKPRTILYVGKGTSKAKLLDEASFAALVKQLKERRISASSYAIGPGPDLRLLGALAAQTGGKVIEESPADAAAIADQLASVAHGPVFWPIPQKVVLSDTIREVYPADLPPLRLDRETVLVGTLQGDGPVTIRASVEGPGGPVDVSWTAPVGSPNEDHNYLPALVDLARKDPTKGLSLPLVDAASLKNAKVLADVGARNLTLLARQALAAGNPAEAERLSQAALKQDPQDPEAQAVLRAARGEQAKANPPAGQPAPAAQPTNLQLRGALEPPAVPDGGALVERYQQKQNLLSQMVSTDVGQTINQARSIMTDNPDAAINELKVQMENVRRVPELDEAVRTRLLGQLEAALREADRRKQIKEERDRQRDITLAQARERSLVQENLQRREEKIRQLIARFNSLMEEGQYRVAEEGAMALRKEAPTVPITELALSNAQFQGRHAQAAQVYADKEQMFTATMFQVEKSHVPFPDDPPIIYTDADTWQQLTARRKERYQAMDLASRGPAEKKILQQLDSPTQLEFTDTQLGEVIQYLKDFHKIEIQLDKKALEAAGVQTDNAITINLKGVSLRSALRLLLRELDLTYLIQNEVLLITSPDEAQNRLSTKVYPVADLVIPIQTPAFQGGFGGLGGWGGGMGSMGGMGGMGMGGFGGLGGWGGGMGMGGMGMGMGGGMWNIPPDRLPKEVRDRLDQLLPKKGAQGFRAFDVPDSVPQNPAAPTPANRNEGTDHEKVQKELISITTPEGYQAFFAAHQNPPVPQAAVRQAVRDLMQEKKFAQISALIEAALRNHQPQPWMYEALGLAMQADGRPIEEVERVILSALDFAQSPVEMTYIGLYLAQLGLDQRAIQIYRQAAQLDPRRPEPYMAALRSAQKAGDLQAKQWASLGVLRQAWSKEQIEVWNTARRVAQSVLEELRSAGKTKEAQEFEKAMQTAMVRDVVIRVSWTGNADVDLLVEEPSGSICSARNRRSSGGGIFLGDVSSRQLDSVREGAAEEVYVCPEGFSGTYRALIRRVWGELTAGKVQVEVFTHFRTDKQRRIAQTIDLKNDEAVVVFDLTGGRRKESLQEQQTANALVDQLTIRQQILAQQIAAAVDPRALAALATSRSNATPQDTTGGGATNPYYPWTIQGAVGYMPVIITLPEGANLSVTGVVSADRRYVRVTCVPLFSRISDVRIFNFVEAEESQGMIPPGGGYIGGGGGGY